MSSILKKKKKIYFEISLNNIFNVHNTMRTVRGINDKTLIDLSTKNVDKKKTYKIKLN